MAKPDWEVIGLAYRTGVLSFRDIGDKYGVTRGAIKKRAKKFDWVCKASTQVRKNGMQSGMQKSKVRTSEKPASAGRTQKSTQPKAELPPDTKPIRGVRADPPTNPFQSGSRQALKHGGYARRLLPKGEVTEDAKALILENELFRLRANNLVAAENIGRWLVKLEDTEGDQERKVLMENISAAEKVVMRNTIRIKSIVGTLATIGRIFVDTDYRKVATDKVSLEADRPRRDTGIGDGSEERDLNDFYSDIQTDAESGPA